MKNLVLVLFVLVFHPLSSEKPTYFGMVISDETQMIIRGSTSINDFSCVSKIMEMKDTIPIVGKGAGVIFSETRMIFRVNSMECGDNYSNKQLRKTLNSDQYPFIIIDLMEIYPDSLSWYKVRAHLNVEVAGNQREQIIQMELKHSTNDNYQLAGTHKIQMSAYGLNPPQPMMGMIKVEDVMEIEMQLKVKLLILD